MYLEILNLWLQNLSLVVAKLEFGGVKFEFQCSLNPLANCCKPFS